MLKKVEVGKDLTPHLSDLVMTKGIVLPSANPSDRGKDIDTVLTRHGLHHFHVSVVGPGNPKGRSGHLIFAEVLDKEFRIVAISDHRAFEQGSAEQLRFFRICSAYVAKDVPPGQAFMANPVMSSGHSLIVIRLFEVLVPLLDVHVARKQIDFGDALILWIDNDLHTQGRLKFKRFDLFLASDKFLVLGIPPRRRCVQILHLELDRCLHLRDHLHLIIGGRDHGELNQLNRAIARFMLDDLTVVKVARVDRAEMR